MKFQEVIDHLKEFGKSKNKKDSEYDALQLKKGIRVEYEHTPSKEAAAEIAKDHLEELPDYYNRLEKMEQEAQTELQMLGKENYIKKYLKRK